MDNEKRELWDRLENEPERAYRAFECFLSLPGGERTLLGAYRRHVGNPDAAKPPTRGAGGPTPSLGVSGLRPTTTTSRACGARHTSGSWRKRRRGKPARPRRPEAATTSL